MDERMILAAFAAERERSFREAAGRTVMKRLFALLDEASFHEDGARLSSPYRKTDDFSIDRNESVPGDGVVTGSGTVFGREVIVAAQDPSAAGGTVGYVHALKLTEAVETAVELGVPFIGIFDSTGLRQNEGLSVLSALAGFLSSLGRAKGLIPRIAILLGPCVSLLSFVAAESDLVFVLEGESSGVSTKERVEEYSPGGVKNRFLTGADALLRQGLATASARDELTLFTTVKRYFDILPDNAGSPLPEVYVHEEDHFAKEAFDELAIQAGGDVQAIAALLSDESGLYPFREQFVPDLMTAFAVIGGQTVGMMGARRFDLTVPMLRKAGEFVTLLDDLNIPLITLNRVEKFAAVPDEEIDLVRGASRLYSALVESDMPRLCLIVGHSAGSAHLVFNSKASGADIVLAWPTASLGSIDAATAVSLFVKDELDEQHREELIEIYRDKKSSPQQAASEGEIDEIILPSSSRTYILSWLETT
jgi:acetyl-CoA carboxylase carboxyltransferase component